MNLIKLIKNFHISYTQTNKQKKKRWKNVKQKVGISNLKNSNGY
jgi:hypothetical protein